jgi:hypothetical protein
MVDDRLIVLLGAGGRGDPYRYCINPMLLQPDDPARDELMKELAPYGFRMDADGNLMLGHHR